MPKKDSVRVGKKTWFATINCSWLQIKWEIAKLATINHFISIFFLMPFFHSLLDVGFLGRRSSYIYKIFFVNRRASEFFFSSLIKWARYWISSFCSGLQKKVRVKKAFMPSIPPDSDFWPYAIISLWVSNTTQKEIRVGLFV